MTQVTVELEDLKALVFTTGAIKTIEGALAYRRRDPFVQPYLEMTEASNRVASAMRHAERVQAGTLIPWEGELTDAEVGTLKMLYLHWESRSAEPWVISPDQKVGKPTPGQPISAYASLEAKGCAQIGQCVSGVVWAGEDRPAITVLPSYAVRITDRGRDKLGKIMATQLGLVSNATHDDATAGG